MAEARALRTMSSVQTPLYGEENTPLRSEHDAGTGYEGATPRQGIAATPNPLATPAHGGITPRSVPGMGATPMRTPARDSLSINDAATPYGETPIDERRRVRDARRSLKAGFASLPKPENNFELAEDEEEEVEEEEVVLTEEDAAERDAKMKAAREEEERREMERRSSVVKQSLPRPVNVDFNALFDQLRAATDAEDELASALMLVNFEVASLMKHDSIAHPLPGTALPGGTPSDYDMPEDDFVALARSAVHAELAKDLSLPGASEEQVRLAINAQVQDDSSAFTTTWAEEKATLVFSPSSQSWVEPSSLSPKALTAAYRAMIDSSRERLVAESTKASKAAKKLTKQLGGYQAINTKAKQNIIDTMEEIQNTNRELESYMMLKTMEEAAAPGRLEKKREEVAVLERRERDLQARYAELNDERRARLAAIEQLEEDKMVIQAQAALDAEEDYDEAAVGQGDVEMTAA
jgi:pre-mRNA-splicing factor CDC5/CEF1